MQELYLIICFSSEHQQVFLIKTSTQKWRDKNQNIKSIHNPIIYKIKWPSINTYNYKKIYESAKTVDSSYKWGWVTWWRKREPKKDSCKIFHISFHRGLLKVFKAVSYKVNPLKNLNYTSSEKNWDQKLSSRFCITTKKTNADAKFFVKKLNIFCERDRSHLNSIFNQQNKLMFSCAFSML